MTRSPPLAQFGGLAGRRRPARPHLLLEGTRCRSHSPTACPPCHRSKGYRMPDGLKLDHPPRFRRDSLAPGSRADPPGRRPLCRQEAIQAKTVVSPPGCHCSAQTPCQRVGTRSTLEPESLGYPDLPRATDPEGYGGPGSSHKGCGLTPTDGHMRETRVCRLQDALHRRRVDSIANDKTPHGDAIGFEAIGYSRCHISRFQAIRHRHDEQHPTAHRGDLRKMQLNLAHCQAVSDGARREQRTGNQQQYGEPSGRNVGPRPRQWCQPAPKPLRWIG